METLHIRLDSKRARKRVDYALGRETPWVCDLGGSQGPSAACTTISPAEWTILREWIYLRGWHGIQPCTTCPVREPQQQRFL
jgi:hypothetical protein